MFFIHFPVKFSNFGIDIVNIGVVVHKKTKKLYLQFNVLLQDYEIKIVQIENHYIIKLD